ncbi:hypothetical protein HDV06_000549, partial [Boothiomyces sp. JEL0866]
MLQSICLEILTVAQHLNLQEYSKVRFSINLNLPHILYTSFRSFYSSRIPGYDISQHIRVSKELITADSLEYFVNNHYFAQFRTSLRIFQNIHWEGLKSVILISEYDSDIILLLLDSYGDQQSNAPLFRKTLGFNSLFTNAVIKYINNNQPRLLGKIIRHVDPSFDNNYPIFLSAQLKRVDCVDILIDHPNVDPSIQNNYVFRSIVDMGSSALVKKLLKDPRVDPSCSNQEAFFNSVRSRRNSIVRLLLQDSRIDPSANSNQSLLFACMLGNFEIVQMLLNDPRIDPALDQCKAFQIACSNGHVEVVNIMLKDCRIDPSLNDNSAFKSAAKNGHIQVVRVLLQHQKVDPSADDCFGFRKAVYYGNAIMVHELILDERIDPLIHDSYAIRMSCLQGNYEIVELLLRDRRIVVHPDCLNNAIESGNSNIVELLLTRIVPDYHSLKHAVQVGKRNVTQLLLNDKRLDPKITEYYSKLIRKNEKVEGFVQSVYDFF